MADGFLWGGINIRKFCRYFLSNIWMIIAIMIITYLGLDIVDKQTYSPRYTSAAVAAVYPTSTSYRYHTIETISNVSSKTDDISSVFNSDLFQTALYNQDPSLQDCTIDSLHIAYTDLLVMHATSSSPENALNGIRAALEYYSRFSGETTGAPEIRVLLGPKAPYLATGSSKIQNHRLRLCVLSGAMMAGLQLIMYLLKKTYKTERRIRNHYEDVRFFSLPYIRSGPESKKGNVSKNNRQEPITKLALEIKQVLHKCNKHSLLVTSISDKEEEIAVVSTLAKELANQEEKVILIRTGSPQHDNSPGIDPSDKINKNTLTDVLQQKCTVKDALLYSEKLNVSIIQCSAGSFAGDIPYSVDDVRRVLLNCQEYADIVLVDGAAWYPFHDKQIWKEAADVAIALCRQEDAGFFEVDKLLRDLQKGNAFFAGCVLVGF